MLISLILTLKPTKDCILPLTTGNFAHACFLNLVGGEDESMAETLHAEGRDKPFTVSPLQGEFENRNSTIFLSKDKEYWFRVTILQEKLSYLLSNISQRPPKCLILQEEELKLKRITASPDDTGWGASTTYEELYNSWIPTPKVPDYKIKMRFYSPTTFRSNHQNIPLPLPNLIFFGLAEKWNRYSPVDLGSDISKIAFDWLSISRYDLKTKILDFGRYRQVGFVGEVEFLMKKDKDDLIKRILHLLADFAFYAGVGYKTTMGMGQVRRID